MTTALDRIEILDENIMGGMCARVCPTETLCEEACVREAAEGKPVKIGHLQRYATDVMMTEGRQPFERADLPFIFPLMLVSVAVVLVLLVGGVVFFKRMERTLADVI